MNIIPLLRRFTIRTRMIGAIAVVLSLLCIVGGAGLWGLAQVSASSANFVESTHARTAVLAELRTAIGDVRRYEKDLLINYDSADKQKAYQPKWRESVELVRSKSRALAKDADPAQAALAGRIDELMAGYTAKAQPVIEAIAVGGYNDAPVANKAIDPAKAMAHEAEQQIVKLSGLLADEARATVSAQRSTSARAWLIFAAALLASVMVVVPLTLANMLSICRPIDRARAQAERIAGGDLGAEIDDDGADESARLLGALRGMQTALQRLVTDVRQSSESIDTASAEIATGNTDLSQRTEQTASNLQQTAGSLQQITSSVRQTADAAAQANQLAASASSVASRGGEVVAQVVATMGEIETSSRRIGDIIGTIDGIAFQTNILALNAAVEAARAGEQGRGFAVVAGEVRSLAQRSAEAAREIKGLIGASVERVEAGTRLVRDAGSTMSEIVDSVRRVTDVIGEITASTNEQSQGIVQINGAVTQLDQMTQQNAALVEESAAAAESLKEQASRLVGVVATFRTGAGVAATPAGAARRAPPPAASEPAAVAQQAIARARGGSTNAASTPAAVGDADWESF